jgi:Fe-S-cluster-containing hydrogenase component 2
VVERDQHTIAYLDEGDFVGEMALLSDQPHSATVRALTPLDMLVLPAEEFHQLLKQCSELERHLQQIAQQRREADATLGSDEHRIRRISQIVGQGLLRGTHLFVRNPALCPPDCRICEEACAARHGQPRLRLNGVLLGDMDIVDTCRQCRVGAECMEVCPEDAFEWNANGALLITEKCTGCGKCLPACPYTAITSVPSQTQAGNPLWQLWLSARHLFGRANPMYSSETVFATHRADKCDLCCGYEDMACISQCPARALRRVPVEELFPM